MLASSFNGLKKVDFVTFNADDISDFAWLNMANVVLEELIVSEYLAFKIRHDIEQVYGSF